MPCAVLLLSPASSLHSLVGNTAVVVVKLHAAVETFFAARSRNAAAKRFGRTYFTTAPSSERCVSLWTPRAIGLRSPMVSNINQARPTLVGEFHAQEQQNL